jgi:hypothetical protein
MILKVLKMAFTGKTNIAKQETTDPIQITNITNLNRLSPQEIELLLLLIKRSTFVGDQLENIYNIVLKLQNDYIEQTK